MTTRSGEKLRRFLGDWNFTVEGELASGERVRGNGSAKGDIVPGGGVLLSLNADVDVLGPFQETNLFGYSESEEKVHRFTVSSLGQVHDHEGVWQGDELLYVEWSGISGGRPMTEKIRYQWKGTEELTVYETDVTAGKVQGTFIYILARAGQVAEENLVAVPT